METGMACRLCPRQCGAVRALAPGRCGAGTQAKIARAAPHFWEEPCISGTKGSGTVFFSGCPLGCVFCQNHVISHGNFGREVSADQLAQVFLRLQWEGVHNLNLVTGTQYAPQIAAALDAAKQRGFALPVVWNTSGYETLETVAFLAKYVDVWLCDSKFFSPEVSRRMADAPDYFAVASAALRQMARLAGPPVLGLDGTLVSGLVVRLLVLPGQRQDAKEILRWVAENLPKEGFLLSLMRQYTPPEGLPLPAPLDRRLASFEYHDVVEMALALGLTGGYTQEQESAQQAYIPPFDLEQLQQI